MNDILDLHTHTTASGHAYSTLNEMVKAAEMKGLELLGISDHSPGMPGSCHEFYFSNFKVIPRHRSGVTILMGCELNIIDHDGNVDLPEALLKRLDYSIASIHPPCYPDRSSIAENTQAYLGAIKNPDIQIIGHPDDSRYPYDYDMVVAAAKEHHKLLEINNSSLSPLSYRQHAADNYRKLLEYCKKYDTSVIVNSDAHIDLDVGNHQRALSLLKEVGFPENLVVNTSKQRLLSFLPNINITFDQEGSDD